MGEVYLPPRAGPADGEQQLLRHGESSSRTGGRLLDAWPLGGDLAALQAACGRSGSRACFHHPWPMHPTGVSGWSRVWPPGPHSTLSHASRDQGVTCLCLLRCYGLGRHTPLFQKPLGWGSGSLLNNRRIEFFLFPFLSVLHFSYVLFVCLFLSFRKFSLLFLLTFFFSHRKQSQTYKTVAGMGRRTFFDSKLSTCILCISED